VKLKITLENKTYEVEVEATEPETPRGSVNFLIQPGAARIPAGAPPPPVPAGGQPFDGDESKVLRSPLNGLVVRLSAQPGQQIQSGDTILVVEAMKMETNITAPDAGKIAKINVSIGDSVTSGQILVEFE
jgi:methylmalonyl-CoA carboxyltransferase small subunit